jgi:hypothetical protein
MGGSLRALAAAFVLLALAGGACAKSFEFLEVDSDITVNPDSTFLVSETYHYRFNGSFSYAYRIIYTEGTGGISNASVWEGATPFSEGSGPGQFEASYGAREVNVTYHFSAQDEDREFTVKYEVSGAINYLDDADEFFWKAMPSDRAGAIGHAKVTVHLPGDVQPAGVRIYSGAENQRFFMPDARTLVFEGDEVPPGDSFEVRAELPKGTVAHVFSLSRYLNEGIGPLACPAIPLASLLAMVLLFFLAGRDPRASFAAFRVTAPPDALEPGVVGTLFDERADNRDVMATIYDLARRGFIEISEAEGPELPVLGRLGGREFGFGLKKGMDDPALKPFERKLLEAFFSGSGVVSTVSIRRDRGFAGRLSGVKEELYAEAVRKGFFAENPGRVRAKFAIIGGAVLFVAGAAAIAGAVTDAQCASTFVLLVLGGIAAAGVPIIAVGQFMPRKTPAGAEEKAKWEAFRRYLLELASFKSAPEGKELFERFYPFAVAFGIEEGLAKSFERIGTASPAWFIPIYAHGGHGGGLGGAGSGIAPLSALQGATSGFFSALSTASGGGHGGAGGGGGGGGGGAGAG